MASYSFPDGIIAKDAMSNQEWDKASAHMIRYLLYSIISYILINAVKVEMKIK